MKGVPLNEELYNYIVSTFAKEDDILKQVVDQAASKKFPLIQISPENGKFLYMLIKIINAKRVLEIGTLTGYSSIWMARALPEGGKLTTLEINPDHAEEARKNFKNAGLDNKIELILGSAMESLNKLLSEKFDFVFIDADKTGYPAYFDKVIGVMNKGGLITADNTLRDGDVVKENADEGTKAVQVFNKKVANDQRVESLLVPISDGLTVCWVK
ncbi:MAG: O-methyltransferase [Chlorobi bacterium]|nr:O-methyltransferase [Chlorobiota bacterium]MCI0716459.1 O-methyltransferase [Chlorobiota bacterium]